MEARESGGSFFKGFPKEKTLGGGWGGGEASGGKRTISVVCNRVIVLKRVVPIQLVVDLGDEGGKGLGVCSKQSRVCV